MTSFTSRTPSTCFQCPDWVLDSFFLTCLISFFYFLFLSDARPLFTPDEGRYAEIAREMITSHHYITPHLNDIKYFEKPPLFYWLETLALHLFGLHIAALRKKLGPNFDGIETVRGVGYRFKDED